MPLSTSSSAARLRPYSASPSLGSSDSFAARRIRCAKGGAAQYICTSTSASALPQKVRVSSAAPRATTSSSASVRPSSEHDAAQSCPAVSSSSRVATAMAPAPAVVSTRPLSASHIYASLPVRAAPAPATASRRPLSASQTHASLPVMRAREAFAVERATAAPTCVRVARPQRSVQVPDCADVAASGQKAEDASAQQDTLASAPRSCERVGVAPSAGVELANISDEARSLREEKAQLSHELAGLRERRFQAAVREQRSPAKRLLAPTRQLMAEQQSELSTLVALARDKQRALQQAEAEAELQDEVLQKNKTEAATLAARIASLQEELAGAEQRVDDSLQRGRGSRCRIKPHLQRAFESARFKMMSKRLEKSCDEDRAKIAKLQAELQLCAQRKGQWISVCKEGETEQASVATDLVKLKADVTRGRGRRKKLLQERLRLVSQIERTNEERRERAEQAEARKATAASTHEPDEASIGQALLAIGELKKLSGEARSQAAFRLIESISGARGEPDEVIEALRDKQRLTEQLRRRAQLAQLNGSIKRGALQGASGVVPLLQNGAQALEQRQARLKKTIGELRQVAGGIEFGHIVDSEQQEEELSLQCRLEAKGRAVSLAALRQQRLSAAFALESCFRTLHAVSTEPGNARLAGEPSAEAAEAFLQALLTRASAALEALGVREPDAEVTKARIHTPWRAPTATSRSRPPTATAKPEPSACMVPVWASDYQIGPETQVSLSSHNQRVLLTQADKEDLAEASGDSAEFQSRETIPSCSPRRAHDCEGGESGGAHARRAAGGEQPKCGLVEVPSRDDVKRHAARVLNRKAQSSTPGPGLSRRASTSGMRESASTPTILPASSEVYQIFGPASGAHTAYSCKASSASTRTCDTRPERDPPRKTSFSALTRGLPFREPQGQSHEVRKIGAQATSEGSFCAQAASATNKSRMKGVPLQRSFKAP